MAWYTSGGNVAIGENGLQFVSRYSNDGVSVERTYRYRRAGPDEAWDAGLLVGSLGGGGSLGKTFDYTRGGRHCITEAYWPPVGDPLSVVSDDGGDAYVDATVGDSDPVVAYLATVPEWYQYFYRDHDGRLAAIRDRTFCVLSPLGSVATMWASGAWGGADGYRNALFSRSGGGWSVVGFGNSLQRQYDADGPGGSTWSLTYSEAGPYTNFDVGASCAGRNGTQALIGQEHSPAGNQQVWSRSDPTGVFTGPYLDVAMSNIAHAYLYERPDGVWECGWRTMTDWVVYQAATPSGTWAVVS